MKKIIRYLLLLLILMTIVGWLMITFWPESLVSFALNRQMKGQQELIQYGESLLTDDQNIRVVTVGTSSPFPGERAQTGTAIIVNGHFFMFDIGDGVVQKAENIGLPLDRIDGIFITHWHSDHMIDLPSMISRSWLLGRTNDLHLYGPEGADTLNQAIDQFLHIENRHRVDHHGAELMNITQAMAIPHEFKVAKGEVQVIYNQDGIKITAFDVDHEPVEPAVGYVIEYNGKKVVISGDTKKNELLIQMSQGADMLIHEVILNSLLTKMEARLKDSGNTRNSIIVHDIQDYHTPPSEVAEIAAQAKVKKLVLHHFVPPPDQLLIKNLYKKELSAYDGPIAFANDGDIFIIE